MFAKAVFCRTMKSGLLPKRQNLDSSKLKVFADKNFKLEENGRKFSKWVENTVGKVEIACYKQFLHFLQCFQKNYSAGLVLERVNCYNFSHQENDNCCSKILSLPKPR